MIAMVSKPLNVAINGQPNNHPRQKQRKKNIYIYIYVYSPMYQGAAPLFCFIYGLFFFCELVGWPRVCGVGRNIMCFPTPRRFGSRNAVLIVYV